MTGPSVPEEAICFGCQGEHLVGVLSHGAPAATTALLVVVGGPQVRTGSQRQFTQLCRLVAGHGVPALRFDVRGMGDSTGAPRSFEEIGDDIGAAIDALQRRLVSVRRIVLWGLCDGASASAMYLHSRSDPRVAGLVMLNPWVRSAHTLARSRARSYYPDRLRRPEFWKKLLTGRVRMRSAQDMVRTLIAAVRGGGQDRRTRALEEAPGFQERMLLGVEAFKGPALLVLSGNDYTAREFVELVALSPRWRAALERDHFRRLELPGADHTFSDPDSSRAVRDKTAAWILSDVLAA